ncbi:hypothetical protein J4557_37900 [Actinomadura nitritigenes]|uniref:Uncharacterized protein n=1 Tax=Actinomadura nitritigenes TaxID=134602 RepID=A0ABS3RAP9_9ACTN|nr:hypothetical protein [Actinomadura nitritigenes]MBO2443313.1 hypothetical protein [Actinomadura nitritigenes]
MDQPPAGGAPGEDPDVLLDVPVVKVDEIELEVDELRADVSLHAAVLDVLSLGVGADVTLGRVSLVLKGVEAQALLKVRLDNVARIIDRVLETVDANPELLAGTARGAGAAAGELGGGAGGALRDAGAGTARAVDDAGRGAGRAIEGLDAGRAARAPGGDVKNRARNGTEAHRPPRRPHVGREPGPEPSRPSTPPPAPGPPPRRDEQERRRDERERERRHEREPRAAHDERDRQAARDVPERPDDLAAGELAAALTRKSVRAGRDLIGGVLKRLPGM